MRPSSTGCRQLAASFWTAPPDFRPLSLRTDRCAAIAPTDRQFVAAHRTHRCPGFLLHHSWQQGLGRLSPSRATTPTNARTPWTWPTPPFPTASSRRCCGFTRRITTSSTASGRRKRRPVWRCRGQPGADRQGSPRRAGASRAPGPGRVFSPCCAITAPPARGIPPAPSSSRNIRIPERIFVQHNQEGLGAPVVSLPVQGTVAADGVAAARQLTALVGGAPTTTITLRLAWNALGSRLLLQVDPSTLPAERYKVLSLRVGQSTEAANAANRDQDFTLEVSSGSRTAAFPASSLHRLLYPDPRPLDRLRS